MEKSKFIMISGLPASGKSTYAEEISKKENAFIHSSDKLRIELYGDVNECSKNDELFIELHKRIKQDLINGKNVIYDATNISHKKRKAFLEYLKKVNCTKHNYLVATPYEQCLNQNNLRERKVPEYVIKKMYLNFYIPQFYEGWDEINIFYNTDKQFDYAKLLKRLTDIPHDNPHHKLSIGDHCLQCASNIYKYQKEILFYPAMLHDIGKEFTKEFKNTRGEVTEYAHYYQHHLVSGYLALFYLRDMDNLLEIIKYIQWHMQLFFMEKEKTIQKFIKLVGQDFYDNLLLLHQADRDAH